MDLKLTFMDSLCETREFTINGIDAHHEDFGEKYDADSESAEEYGCGDMQFIGKESTPEILAKYSITQSEYDEIVSQLSALSFGNCGWCI